MTLPGRMPRLWTAFNGLVQLGQKLPVGDPHRFSLHVGQERQCMTFGIFSAARRCNS